MLDVQLGLGLDAGGAGGVPGKWRAGVYTCTGYGWTSATDATSLWASGTYTTTGRDWSATSGTLWVSGVYSHTGYGWSAETGTTWDLGVYAHTGYDWSAISGTIWDVGSYTTVGHDWAAIPGSAWNAGAYSHTGNGWTANSGSTWFTGSYTHTGYGWATDDQSLWASGVYAHTGYGWTADSGTIWPSGTYSHTGNGWTADSGTIWPSGTYTHTGYDWAVGGGLPTAAWVNNNADTYFTISDVGLSDGGDFSLFLWLDNANNGDFIFDTTGTRWRVRIQAQKFECRIANDASGDAANIISTSNVTGNQEVKIWLTYDATAGTRALYIDFDGAGAVDDLNTGAGSISSATIDWETATLWSLFARDDGSAGYLGDQKMIKIYNTTRDVTSSSVRDAMESDSDADSCQVGMWGAVADWDGTNHGDQADWTENGPGVT